MMNKLEKKQGVVLMRDGIEIWVDEDKALEFGNDLSSGKKGFTKIGGQVINCVDVEGIFSPEDIADMKHKKNGEYKCQFGVWHSRGTSCTCRPEVESISLDETIQQCDPAKVNSGLREGLERYIKEHEVNGHICKNARELLNNDFKLNKDMKVEWNEEGAKKVREDYFKSEKKKDFVEEMEELNEKPIEAFIEAGQGA